MLEKYGKLMVACDILIALGLLFLAVNLGSLVYGGLLAFQALWVVYKLYKANAAVEADRVAARYEQTRSNPSVTQPYVGGGYASQPAPTQPTIIHNNTSNSGSDFVMGMALGTMMSGHSAAPAAAAAVTVHHVYDEEKPLHTSYYSDEPAALAPITSEQLDSGYTPAAAPSTEPSGEALAPITSEELDRSSSSSSSWSSTPSSDSSSSSSDSSPSWGSSSSSSSSSDWGSSSSSSSSYDSGSSSSSSWD
jgi:hypothetical protein